MMISRGLTMHEIEKSRSTRDAIRNGTSIYDFLIEKGIKPSKSYDGKHVYKCPIHAGDNSPSFYVYEPSDGYHNFYCFGCKRWGDIVDLKSQMEKISVSDAAGLLCKNYGINAVGDISEYDLLDAEIGIWEGREKVDEAFDVSSTSFALARIFRNMIKVSKLDPYLADGDDGIFSLMSEFDKSIRNKDYNKSRSIYMVMQNRFKNG
jgi:hypothetical protein